MPTLKAPESAKALLVKLDQLSDEDFQQLIKAVSGLPKTVDISSLSDSLEEKIGSLPIFSDDILIHILGMNSFRLDEGMTAEKFSNELTRSIEIESTTLRKRLTELLEVESIVTLARARNIFGSHDNLFESARIFSDVRPVFDVGCTKINGAMIVHNLMIEYSNNGETKTMYIALDENDLSKLKKVLDRAETKTTNISSLIEKMGVSRYA